MEFKWGIMQKWGRSIALLLITTALVLFFNKQPKVLAASDVPLTGVNLAGAEFGEQALPGVYGSDYTYPTAAEVDYFIAQGMNVFRLPFRWERLQPALSGDLAGSELARLDRFVNYATERGATVILSPHNSAHYYGRVIGSAEVPTAALADFWRRVAAHYHGNQQVIFSLMNEPHSLPTETWREQANAAIAAIRQTGATQLILVAGNGWSGAHSWGQNWYGTANAEAMLEIIDPGHNYAFEVYLYLDDDASGHSEQCLSPTIGAERLAEFTAWLREHGHRGFLGKFAGSRHEMCYAALEQTLAYLHQNAEVWLGWTYWAAGPWWAEYRFTLEPLGKQDRPQLAPLKPYLALVQ